MLPQLLRLRPGASACRCVSCVSRAAVTKPGTSAGVSAKGNGRLTILFYSSIISTAAAVDSRAKQSRRKELDKKISDLEESLRRPDHTEDSVAVKAASFDSDGIQETEAIASAAPSATSSMPRLPHFVTPTDLNSRDGQLTLLEKLVFSSDEERPFQEPSASTSRWSMYATDEQVNEQRAWTPKKLLNVEYRTAQLAAKLMSNPRKIDSVYRQQLSDTLHDLGNRTEALKTAEAHNIGQFERLSFPQYRSSSAGMLREERTKLNKLLLQLCQARARHAISDEELLSKVAYNLLVSPAPPDLQTFSTLISQFSNLGFPAQAEAVIMTLTDSHIRHNELSVDAILSHYRRIRDRERFHEFVLKVQGFFQGLQLAHPNEQNGLAQACRIRTWGNKKIASVNLDDRLFNTIISGYRVFGMAGSAQQWENARTAAGYSSDLALLLPKLASAACKSDLQNGLQLWGRVECVLSQPEMVIKVCKEHVRSAYHYMLGLCRNTGQMSEHKRIYEAGLKAGFTLEELRRNCGSYTPAPHVRQILERRRRLARIAQRQAEQLEEEARLSAIYALADKILDAGLSLNKVKQMFSEKGKEALYAAWLREQPWLANQSPIAYEEIFSFEEALAAENRAALNKRHSFFRPRLETAKPPPPAPKLKSSDSVSEIREVEGPPREVVAGDPGVTTAADERGPLFLPEEQQQAQPPERAAFPPVVDKGEDKSPVQVTQPRKRPTIKRRLWHWDEQDSPFETPRLAAVVA